MAEKPKLESEILLNALVDAGYTFFSGIPCSTQAPIFNSLHKYPNIQYIPAAHPGEAAAIALGAQLIGQKTVVLCQNTALGDIVLLLITAKKMGVPLLILLSWRSMKTLNQNDILGKITIPLLDLLEISHETISSETKENDINKIIEKISIAQKNMRSFAVLTSPETFNSIFSQENFCMPRTSLLFEKTVVYHEELCKKELMSRYEILIWLASQRTQEMIFLTPEGNCTKELFSVGDVPQNLYLCPLGYVSSIGLGLALNTVKKVVVLDGDGSIIMRLQNLSTIGFCRPSNFIHILFNNLQYETTGRQPAISESIDFSSIIQGVHYKTFYVCSSLKTFKRKFKECLRKEGPHFLYVEVNASKAPCPSVANTLLFYAQRLRKVLCENS